ncbi:MAG: helix-turn-helix transcriptional regulator [Candidatus Sumerlaeia bacterium]|nr:helix-turn-helix transcriptional regulator [Candidatus Sumerlaeia bacterium]
MENILGVRIAEAREKLGLTQDQFGARYGVSGPAIFKFEKGYVKPSLDLWMKIARDCDIPEKKAVLLWIRVKLPKEYQSYIDLSSVSVQEPPVGYGKEKRLPYARIADPREIRERIATDPAVPAGMKALFADDEFWGLYRPTGQEIDLLIEKFGSYRAAKESLFRDAIRLIREFVRSEY